MSVQELSAVASSIASKGKGILAADESTPTIAKRFAQIDTESNEESRRGYRELLFTTPGVSEFISGVILFDETLRQATKDGVPFAKYLSDHGMIPGIKVDKGAKPLPGFPGEKVTEGLDGLRERLEEYRGLGAKFAKWRAVIDISDVIPTDNCVRANAHALARYAALCQEAGIVPIVEPEVLMDGGHTIERCEEVTNVVLRETFRELAIAGVAYEGMLLKPNMVISGKKCSQQAGVEEVAVATIRCLTRFVPTAVPGIMFLSGGQSDEDATAHLNAMNALGEHPWEVSFSYGRALQQATLKAWAGSPASVNAAQTTFYKRAKLNGLARYGKYNADMEAEAA